MPPGRRRRTPGGTGPGPILHRPGPGRRRQDGSADPAISAPAGHRGRARGDPRHHLHPQGRRRDAQPHPRRPARRGDAGQSHRPKTTIAAHADPRRPARPGSATPSAGLAPDGQPGPPPGAHHRQPLPQPRAASAPAVAQRRRALATDDAGELYRLAARRTLALVDDPDYGEPVAAAARPPRQQPRPAPRTCSPPCWPAATSGCVIWVVTGTSGYTPGAGGQPAAPRGRDPGPGRRIPCRSPRRRTCGR